MICEQVFIEKKLRSMVDKQTSKIINLNNRITQFLQHSFETPINLQFLLGVRYRSKIIKKVAVERFTLPF